MSVIDDRSLAECSLKGDAEAFSRLIARYKHAVYSICLSFVGDFDLAEDLAQLADDHAAQACLAALDMQARLVEWRAENKPALRVRYGIYTGSLLIGDMGARQMRDVTVMGDPIGLASRLETANRFYGTQIMISERTLSEAKEVLEVRELDRIRLSDNLEPVTVYEVLTAKGELDNTASKDAGSLGHATFKVLEDLSDSTRVELTSASYNELVTVGSDGATVIIGGGPSKPTPDFTGDGQVAFSDFILFAQAFGRKKGDANFDSRIDLNQNGSVDFPDFILFAQAFGKPL